jgi:hypothetical protein
VLNKLLVDAKFFAIKIETVTRQVRIPDPKRFVEVTLAGDEAMIEQGLAALAPFIDGDQLAFALTSLVAVGRVKT